MRLDRSKIPCLTKWEIWKGIEGEVRQVENQSVVVMLPETMKNHIKIVVRKFQGRRDL